MHATRTIATFCTLVVGWTVPLAAQGPCVQITTACKNAGFTQGGASGSRLLADCIIPIIQGIAQPAAATRPLPQVAPQVVAACKASHPDFGQGKGPTSAAAIKPAPASAALPLATPVPPSASGSAVTNGNGMTRSNSRLGAGLDSLQPRRPGDTSVKAAPASWPMTCQIGQMNVAGVAGDSGANAFVDFSLTNGPASSGLKPGQCAFEDRAVKASEPQGLCFPASIPGISFRGRSVWYSPTFKGPGASVLQSALLGPTRLTTFMVHKGLVGGANSYCWIVDHFGV